MTIFLAVGIMFLMFSNVEPVEAKDRILNFEGC
jgi:hypothetical protein